jgi:hypothetical protein
MDSRTKIILQFLVKNDKIAIFPRPDRITNQIDIINQKIR